MDIDRFLALLNDPEKSKQDLMTMRENAMRSNAIEHVHLAEKILDTRFPGRNSVRARRGGSTPTNVMFFGKQQHFSTAKDAYVWLIERFTQHYPKPFVDLDWETLFVAKGPRALFFAKSVRKLFGNNTHLAEDKNKYHHLTNGWYAKLVLSNKQKLELLMKFSTVASLRFGTDWDWNDLGKTHPHIDADELLRELGDGL
jgi:hypothetical protein